MASSPGSITIKLLESNKKIQAKIYNEIRKELNKRIRKNTLSVENQLRALVMTLLRQSPEMVSLGSIGPETLSGHFGIPAGQAAYAVDSIISSIANSLVIKVEKIDAKLRGSISFNFQERTFSNLLSLISGHVQTRAGSDLHWLEWLLLKGDTTIIVGYEYLPSTKGRSRGGTMVPAWGGGAWRVPPQFSGTESNNFITRAFQGGDKEISKILKGLLK